MKRVTILVLVVFSLILLGSCADTVLHNTPASYVQIEVKNFPLADGTYRIGGTFMTKSWFEGNNSREIKIANHAGTYNENAEGLEDYMIISPSFQFTVCDSSWTRAWYPGTKGNDYDGKPSDGNLRNFHFTVPMDGAVHKMTLDFSANPIKLSLDGSAYSD